MSLGSLFMIVAFILFVFAGIGVTIIPNPVTWGFAALTLGLLLSGVPAPWSRSGPSA